jgi:hypothetical protein
MPYLELLALVLAAATWAKHFAGRKIEFRTWSDCLPVVYQTNSLIATVPRSMGLVRHLSTLAALHDFDFRTRHIAGVVNVAADALSRDDMSTFRSDQPHARRTPSCVAVLPPLRFL